MKDKQDEADALRARRNDRYRRTNRSSKDDPIVDHAADAVVRVLKAAGIPVPSELPNMMALDSELVHPAESIAKRTADGVAEAAALAAARRHAANPTYDFATRRDAMLALGWPSRALEHATRAHQTAALDALERWQSNHCALVLAGGKGVGKSVAAAYYALHDRSMKVMRFARAATLVRMSRFGGEFAALIAEPALCIDDLGAEYVDAKGSFLSDLEELIDTFYADRRPMIITTNLDGDAFAERYGSRISDRIKECASWVPVEGDSMRSNEPMPWEE